MWPGLAACLSKTKPSLADALAATTPRVTATTSPVVSARNLIPLIPASCRKRQHTCGPARNRAAPAARLLVHVHGRADRHRRDDRADVGVGGPDAAVREGLAQSLVGSVDRDA